MSGVKLCVRTLAQQTALLCVSVCTRNPFADLSYRAIAGERVEGSARLDARGTMLRDASSALIMYDPGHDHLTLPLASMILDLFAPGHASSRHTEARTFPNNLGELPLPQSVSRLAEDTLSRLLMNESQRSHGPGDPAFKIRAMRRRKDIPTRSIRQGCMRVMTGHGRQTMISVLFRPHDYNVGIAIGQSIMIDRTLRAPVIVLLLRTETATPLAASRSFALTELHI